MRILYNINEKIYHFDTKEEMQECDQLCGSLQRDCEFDILLFHPYEEEQEKNCKLSVYRALRADCFEAFDKFINLLNSGLEDITDEEREEIKVWRQKLRDVTEEDADPDVLLEENIPAKVRYYYKNTTPFKPTK